MSAFMVSRLTIHRAVTAMLLTDCYMQPKYVPAEECDSLGKRLILMNGEALHARYSDPIPRIEDIDYRHETKDWSNPFVLYQACCCLRYQCSEGKVPETNILYGQLSNTIDRIAHHIVRSHADFKTEAVDKAWQ